MTLCLRRVSNMLSAIDKITGGKGSSFFLLIDQTKLAGVDPLEVEWISGKRNAVKLID
jgi:hypothetical protein